MEPVSEKTRTIRLVARPEFRFGRAAGQSDVVARFPSRVPDATALTKFVGRIHVRARLEQSEIVFFDGTEEAASHNGSFLKGMPLDNLRGTILRGPASLHLASHWCAVLAPVLPAEPVSFKSGKGELAVAEAPPRWSALCVHPAQGSEVLEDACWLIGEVGFGLTADGKLIWDTEALAPAAGSFRRCNDSFFLVNHALEAGEMAVDEHPCSTGTAIPLCDGMKLTLGACEWRLRVQ